MILGKRTCAYEGCNAYRSFAPEGSKKAKFCAHHAEPGMECRAEEMRPPRVRNDADLRSTRLLKREFCARHAKPGMVDVCSRLCAHPGCRTRPSYGEPGKTPEFCSGHAKEGMTIIRGWTCSKQGCRRPPTHGKVGNSKAAFCEEHAPEGMVMVVEFRTRGCIHPGCTKRSSFGAKDSGKAEFCATHAREGLVNVFNLSKSCIHQAAFKSLPSEWKRVASGRTVAITPRTAWFLQASIRVATRVVTRRQSTAETRTAIPNSASGMPKRRCWKSTSVERTVVAWAATRRPRTARRVPRKKPLYCAAHAPEDAVNVTSKTCDHPWGCANFANYGRGESGKKFCKLHARESTSGLSSPTSVRRLSAGGGGDCAQDRSEADGGSRVRDSGGRRTRRSPWTALAGTSAELGGEVKLVKREPAVPSMWLQEV